MNVNETSTIPVRKNDGRKDKQYEVVCRHLRPHNQRRSRGWLKIQKNQLLPSAQSPWTIKSQSQFSVGGVEVHPRSTLINNTLRKSPFGTPSEHKETSRWAPFKLIGTPEHPRSEN